MDEGLFLGLNMDTEYFGNNISRMEYYEWKFETDTKFKKLTRYFNTKLLNIYITANTSPKPTNDTIC